MSGLPPATGNCYQIVLAVAEAVRDFGCRDVRIVHGIAVGRGDIEGVRIGHAWVECIVNVDDMVVIDASNGLRPRPIDVGSYYLLGRINSQECIRYTIEEHKRMCVERGNFGPWTQAHMEVA